jgi:hypothetical protein
MFTGPSPLRAITLLGATIALLTVATASAGECPAVELGRIQAGDPDAYDGFGRAVAIDGAFAVVGANYDDNANGQDAGAVYIFQRDLGGPENWGQVTKIIAADGQPGDNFGFSVDISGDYIVVGAPYADNQGNNTGAAYIFYRHQGGPDNWGQQAKLYHPQSLNGTDDKCGHAVAIAGQLVLLGVPYNDWFGPDAGAVTSYGRSGSSWIYLSVVYPSQPVPTENFGYAVDMTTQNAVVGAWFHPGGGCAYAFNNVGWWNQEAILLPTGPDQVQEMGFDVSISGETAIIGAPEDDTLGLEAGAAYVFDRAGGTWPLQTKLFALDGAQSDRFGSAVAIDNQTIVVGAPDDANQHGNYAGSAYTFCYDGQGWNQSCKLVPAAGVANDHFANDAGVSGGTAIFGNSSYDSPQFACGAAYLFVPIANDDCFDAEPVGDVADLPFDTTCATFDGEGTCMYGGNIWYCYTASCTGTATISLCGSNYDTKLAIYDGCVCGPLGPQLCCNDDSCGLQSLCTVNVVADQQYLIEVGGFAEDAGPGVLSISCLPRGACCVGEDCIGTMPEDECDAALGDWYPGESCDDFVCPTSDRTWLFDDKGVAGWGLTYTEKWEHMDFGLLPECIYQDLDTQNPYYAASYPLVADYSGYRFYAEIWMANNYTGQSELVTAELRRGQWGEEGTLLASASVEVISYMAASDHGQPYTFDFGTIEDLVLDDEAIVVKILYLGTPGDTHIYWNGEECPSALHAQAPGDPVGMDTVVCEPQGGPNPSHPDTYWYDVTPGDFGRCDFHVRVFDPDPQNYTNVVMPPNWQFTVHQVAGQWWATWWNPDCTNAIFDPFRFQFDNPNPARWGDWTTTISATDNPHLWVIDFAGRHFIEPDGSGGLVHVPGIFELGDTNCDGVVSAADIDPFVIALTGGADAYYAAFPSCDYYNADCNGDGSVSPADIDPFVLILTGG